MLPCSTRRHTTASRSQELHRRCAKAGSTVSAVSVHPGAAATTLFARQLERWAVGPPNFASVTTGPEEGPSAAPDQKDGVDAGRGHAVGRGDEAFVLLGDFHCPIQGCEV